jgi:hypothetical protein
MTRKLTLSVDKRVVDRAKRHARRQGTSVSQMVERFLRTVTSSPNAGEAPPVLRRLRGALRGAKPSEYAAYLEKKYR